MARACGGGSRARAARAASFAASLTDEDDGERAALARSSAGSSLRRELPDVVPSTTLRTKAWQGSHIRISIWSWRERPRPRETGCCCASTRSTREALGSCTRERGGVWGSRRSPRARAEIELLEETGLLIPRGWPLSGVGRAALLDVMMRGLERAERLALAQGVFKTGDNDERAALLRALSILPEPERFVDLAIDACRTHVQTVFEAIACENPYPSRYFPEHNFNQMVLKAFFTGVAVKRIEGLARAALGGARAHGRGVCERTPRRGPHRPRRSGFRDGSPTPRLTLPEKISMKMFDPHIHMTSRTTDDYQAMADAGIRAIVEPAFWLGQPRTHVGSFEDYFLSLLGLGALSRQPVRHPPPLHDGPEPEGGEQQPRSPTA